MSKKVRLLDIAHEAGVSRATVSLALRQHTSIPVHTRDRIKRIARELGYVYNRGAASLRTASTNLVGIVVHDITNPYFAEVVASIQDEMRGRGRIVLFGNSSDTHDCQVELISAFREYNVDGVILCPSADTDINWLRQIQSWKLPLVLFSRDIPDLAIDYVAANNEGGMHDATMHLLSLGHKRIAMIGANYRISTGQERLRGYLEALRKSGITVDQSLIIEGPATRDFGMQALFQVMANDNPATAAVCFNDVIGFGVMLGLRQMGLEAGTHFSVVGFDDVSEAVLWRPALTSVDFSREGIGREAVALLMRRIASPEASPKRIIIEGALCPRDSCGYNRFT